LRLVDVNETTLKMYGAESKSVLIDGYSSVWSQETESCLRMSFVAVATGVRRMTCEDVNVSLDGEEIHVAETWAVAPGYEDSYGRVYLSDVDITDRRLAELALRESQDRYRSLFEQSPVGVWTYDTSGVVADCNESFATILGSPRERLIGFDMKTMQDQRVRPAVDAALQGEVGFYEGEYRATLNQKHVIWISARTAPLRDAWGGTTGGMGVISDLTQLRETEERVKYLAVHDEVTGLANRTLFQDRLGQAIAFAGRSKQKLAVAVVDIDRFRHINETLGYAAGDRLLREVGERIIESVRGDDSVARGSGDEYLLLFPGLARAQDVVRVADRVMDGFAAPWTVAGDEYFLTPSMGVAVYPADGTDAETLVSNAEKALHRAKQLGRSHCQYFDASMNLAIAQRLTLERELHHALERNEFEVHYQPLVDVASGTLAGFEALVRWRHPKRGLLLPGEFIELAESTGLIIPMGERVLRAACRQAKAWMDEGRGDIVVSVNLSPRQFFQGDLVATVAGALATSGLKTGALGIEVTETVAVEDVDRASSILEQLRTLGVRVGLDDFGTGYSSLSHLREVPIDIVKIDRSFIAGVNNGGGDAAVASAIVAMGRTMGLTVIAEGVETTEQLAFVRERGCDLFQGFLVSRAVLAEECAAFFGGRLA
jgi:diguanylate cyclase (GGDEF)-like protein/PAS domain S-box-containing protein